MRRVWACRGERPQALGLRNYEWLYLHGFVRPGGVKARRGPRGIHLVFLPSYSPELQPAEHLWPLVREAIANRRIETLDELEELLVQPGNPCTAASEPRGINADATATHGRRGSGPATRPRR